MSRWPRPLRRPAAVVAALLAAACAGTEPPAPTTVQIAGPGGASAVTLASLGQTVQLSARVLDQNGDSMAGVSVTWSSTAPGVASVAAGLVTAVDNGAAQVTATVGDASGSLNVTVAQAATSIQKNQGDLQTGAVGTALPTALRVRVVDALGVRVAGAAVTWAVVSGGGSVAGANADSGGYATATWTLGTLAGAASVSATSGSLSVTFSATKTAGPVAGIIAIAGASPPQSATINTAVAIDPQVRVTDQYGNIKPGITVNWTVSGGGGSVTPPTSVTNASGETGVTSWTLGSGGGANALDAAVIGVDTVTFAATATVPGAPATIATFLGNNQTGLQGYAVNVRPAARVTDALNQPVAGQIVTFAVASGGGSGTKLVDTTDANGVVQVGSWTIQAGTNTMTATTGALTPASFTATGVAPTFNIVIQNVGPAFSPATQAAFDAAVAYWQQIIFQDVPDEPNFLAAAGTCGTNSPAVGPTTVDDVIIQARFDSIDGPLQVLGSAGGCWFRGAPGAIGATILGTMRFDTADVAMLAADGRLNAIILHEMGHVLGFSGFVFQNTSPVCIQNPSSAGSPLDTHFSCANARAVFDSIGGTSFTGGSKVPLENCAAGVPASCGAGQLNGHWREFAFDAELMTPYIEAAGTATPMSIVTIAALQDVGYTVNYAAAQTYSQVFAGPPAARAASDRIEYGDDEYRGPAYFVDRTGRIVRVIERR